jgi:hypothetical protein
MEDNGMAKPFMSITEEKPEEAPVQRAEEVTVEVSENHEIEIDERLRNVVGEGMGITAPVYTTATKGPLKVSYAIIDEKDYYYQIELEKKPNVGDKQILAMLIQAFDTVVPRHIHTYIREPPRDIDWNVYTVVVKEGASLMGAKLFFEKKLVNKLLELDFWGDQ